MDEKLRDILCGVLEVDAVAAGDGVATIANWDSLRHLQLMTAIEESYGILLDPEEMMQLNTVAAIQTMLAARAAA